ncbi:unnamed protein product [Effrenium voratum]|nr:unnamed protein product [Effrenium voratum]CAJ1444651.1 unnamed protein product [Effrenium voratum]
MRAFVDRCCRSRPILVLMLMVSYSVQSLLITKSKSQVTYNSSMAVLLAELLKLVFALVMLPEALSWSKSGSWLYAVPATLYTLQNRLVFEALRCISPPEYQLLNNMKLFTTSILFRVVMKRQLCVLQWLALVLLALGMALGTVPCGPCGINVNASEEGRDVWKGISIMMALAWCSAAAGILNEWLIKKSNNVFEANVWLYMFGVMAAIVQLLSILADSMQMPSQEFTRYPGDHWDGAGHGESGPGYLTGFTTSLLPWSVVLCNALLGQSIAFLFRYADSIVKLYAVNAALVLTTLLSSMFFAYELHFHAVAGYLVFLLSMCLHYTPSAVLLAPDVQLLGAVSKRD